MQRLYPIVAAGAAILLLGLAAGCSDSTTPAPAGEGRLTLTLVDAPGDYDAVNVAVVGVRAHRAGADSVDGWFTVSDDTFTVDLLTLTGGHGVVIADTLLPAGAYTQIRLLLGEGSHVVVDGQMHPLEVPSGGTSGLKLNHPFTLRDGTIYAATLDFDAHRSIHVTGNGRWMMRPVIRIVVDAVSGRLQGVVDPAAARAAVWAVAGGDSALAWADTLTGAFAFDPLAAGTYDVSILPTAAGWSDTTLVGVEVQAGASADLDTVSLVAVP
ncbi:MAG: DUF4382 domain-containing protein [Candidatus Krumholzibacteriia bacterium]